MVDESKRINWIDSCKGFAIGMVVCGHVVQGYIKANIFTNKVGFLKSAEAAIYSFHMPMFLILSGFLCGYSYLSKMPRKKERFLAAILNILFVYFFWSILHWSAKYFFSTNVNGRVLMQDLFLISVRPMAPYWYLYILVILYLGFYYLEGIRIRKSIVLIVLYFIACLPLFVNITHFGGLNELMRFSFFFYIGLYSSKAENKLLFQRNNKKITLGFIFVAIVLLVITWIYRINMIQDVKVIGTFGGLVISIGVMKIFQSKSFLSENKVFKFLGHYSLEIYVAHSYVLTVWRMVVEQLKLNFVVSLIGGVLLGIVLPITLSFVLQKINLHKILFKFADYLFLKKEI